MKLITIITLMFLLVYGECIAVTVTADSLQFPGLTIDGNGDYYWYGGDATADVKEVYGKNGNECSVGLYSLGNNTFSSYRILSEDYAGNKGCAELCVYLEAVTNWERISYSAFTDSPTVHNGVQIEKGGPDGHMPAPLIFSMSKPDEGYYVEAMRMDCYGAMVFGLKQDEPTEIMVLDRVTPTSAGTYDSHSMGFYGNDISEMHVDVTGNDGDSKFVVGRLFGFDSEKLSIRDTGNLTVQGDIYLTTIGTGLIVRSNDGSGWRMTVDNSGNLSAASYVASLNGLDRSVPFDDPIHQPIVYAVGADQVYLPSTSPYRAEITNIGTSYYGARYWRNNSGTRYITSTNSTNSNDGNIHYNSDGAGTGFVYKIGPTKGTLPAWGVLSEMAFYHETGQSGDFSREVLSAMAEGQYRLESEAGGSFDPKPINFMTTRYDWPDQATTRCFNVPAMYVDMDGRVTIAQSRDNPLGIDVPDEGLYLKCPDPVSAGTKDSHSIGWHGKSHDGTTVHDVVWRAKVDVTNQAGKSAWVMTQHLDSNADRQRFRLADDGRVTIPGDAILSNSNCGLVLRSPDGSHWRVTVDNNGVLHVNSISKTPPFAYNDSAGNPLMESKPIVLASGLELDELDMPGFHIDSLGTLTWESTVTPGLVEKEIRQNSAYINGIVLEPFNTLTPGSTARRGAMNMAPNYDTLPTEGVRSELRLYRTVDETTNYECIRYAGMGVQGQPDEYRIQVEANGTGQLRPFCCTLSKPETGFFREAFRVTPDGKVVFGALRTEPAEVLRLDDFDEPSDRYAVWLGKSHDGFAVHEAWWRLQPSMGDDRLVFQHQLDDGGFAPKMALRSNGELQLTGDLYTSSMGKGVILRSPDGSYWRLTVDEAGAIIVNPAYLKGDFNLDGSVDGEDFAIFGWNWLLKDYMLTYRDWVAARDWSRTTNPNGRWSYCNGNLSSPSFGQLCTIGTAHCGLPCWMYPPEPLAAVNGPCGGVDGTYDFIAHGPYLQRWTSDFEGQVIVNGALWQMNETGRQMRFLLLHNGMRVAEVAAAYNESTSQTILGKSAIVYLRNDSGSTNIYVYVRPGDTLDCILDGRGPYGNGVPTSVGCHFKVKRLSQTVPVPFELNLAADNIINLADFSVMASNWLQNDQDDGGLLQSWDAASDWSRTANPNGNWSYHNGNINSLYFAEPAAIGAGPCGNNWMDSRHIEPFGAVDQCPPADADEFQCHGPFLCRWTSDIDGAVIVHGTLWQINETSRQMRFLLRHNGQDVAVVAAAGAAGQTLLGKQYKVILTDGQGGPDILLNVAAGDTIDCILDGLGPQGNGISTGVGAHFSIEQIN